MKSAFTSAVRDTRRRHSWARWACLAGALLLPGFHASSLAQQRVVLEGHQVRVYSVAFSPDGKFLASSDVGTNPVRIWDVAKAKEVIALKGFKHGVSCVAFAPDGKTLAATGGQGEPVQLFDTVTWEVRAKLPKTDGGTRCVAFSADGKVLAAATHGGQVLLWDTASLKPLPAPPDKVFQLIPLAFSPDSKLLAGGGHGRAVLWDLAANKVKAELEGHQSQVRWVGFSPDGATLATLEMGDHKTCSIFVWDPATAKRKFQLDLGGRFGWLCGAAFSPDSKSLAVIGHGHIHLFDLDANKHQAWLKVTENGQCVAFSPDGLTLAAGMDDGTVRLFNVPKK